jgi:hypothetical protein
LASWLAVHRAEIEAKLAQPDRRSYFQQQKDHRRRTQDKWSS